MIKEERKEREREREGGKERSHVYSGYACNKRMRYRLLRTMPNSNL